jgi:hypothetical protein
MEGPLGVLASCPAASTTEVEDVNGGPLGGAGAGLTTVTTEVEDIDGGPPGGSGAPTISAMKHRLWGPERFQSWRSGSAAPVESAPRAVR